MTKPKGQPRGSTTAPAASGCDAAARPAAAWDDVFDKAEMARACAALRDGIDAYVSGESSSVRVPLRQLLLAPLEGFLEREAASLERKAASRPDGQVARAASNLYAVAMQIECACGHGIFGAGPQLQPGDGARWHEELHTAWDALFESVALQHEWERKRRSAINSSSGAADRPKRRACDHDDLIDAFKRLVREGHLPRNARGILVARGVASKSTVWRVTKEFDNLR